MHVVYGAFYLKCYSVHMSILFLKTVKMDLPYIKYVTKKNIV